MIGQREVLFSGYFALEHFYGFVLKLLDAPALHTDKMVVMIPAVEFKHGVTTFKMMANDESRRFKLREHTVDGGQANFFTFGDEVSENFFCAQVAIMHPSSLEDFENLNAWKGNFQARIADVFAFQGVCSVSVFYAAL